jgi:hypothetical protein
MLDLIKDPWTPCPLFTTTEIEERIEKLNEQIPINTINIHIGNISYISDDIHLYMLLEYTEDKEIKQLINKAPGTNDFKFNFNFTLEKSEFRNLFKKSLNIYLIERRG